jgi:N-glycosylase/DNA lyase
MTSLRAIESAVRAICPDIAATIKTKPDRTMSEVALWRELAQCVLSSQVHYETAAAAVRRLVRLSVFSQLASDTWSPRSAENIEAALLRPLNVEGRIVRYRFPASRAAQLAQTQRTLRDECLGLHDLVYAKRESREKRKSLVRLVSGFGPKQASMYLRNCGGSYDLAILDRHTIRYMHAIGLITARQVERVGSLPQYEEIEDCFSKYSTNVGYPPGYVDWAIWIVMREFGARAS